MLNYVAEAFARNEVWIRVTGKSPITVTCGNNVLTSTAPFIPRLSNTYPASTSGNSIALSSSTISVSPNLLNQTDGQPTAAIAGGCVAAVVLIILVFILICVLRRRKQGKYEDKQDEVKDSPSVSSARSDYQEMRERNDVPLSSDYADIDFSEEGDLVKVSNVQLKDKCSSASVSGPTLAIDPQSAKYVASMNTTVIPKDRRPKKVDAKDDNKESSLQVRDSRKGNIDGVSEGKKSDDTGNSHEPNINSNNGSDSNKDNLPDGMQRPSMNVSETQPESRQDVSLSPASESDKVTMDKVPFEGGDKVSSRHDREMKSNDGNNHRDSNSSRRDEVKGEEEQASTMVGNVLYERGSEDFSSEKVKGQKPGTEVAGEKPDMVDNVVYEGGPAELDGGGRHVTNGGLNGALGGGGIPLTNINSASGNGVYDEIDEGKVRTSSNREGKNKRKTRPAAYEEIGDILL